MEFFGQSQSYNTYGASRIYSSVAALLSVRLGDYGPGIESIELVACLPSRRRKPLRTLESLFDQFHRHLDALPQVTFRRKLKRVEIRFRSEHFMAEDNEAKPSADKCNKACKEIAAALQLLKKRIKPSDHFEVDRFLTDASDLLATRIDSLKEWESLGKQADEKWRAIRATKSPWELLEIDWSHYHPRAKEILDDPFFWERADDLAPNGNDTGADLLDDYRRWDKRNRNRSPMDFLDQLIPRWGIKPIDWSITDEKAVRAIKQEDPIALSLCDEAAIGLAFAVIKMRATCPSNVIDMALAALIRTAFLVQQSNMSSDIKASWDTAITKMRGKLESLENSASRKRIRRQPR